MITSILHMEADRGQVIIQSHTVYQLGARQNPEDA